MRDPALILTVDDTPDNREILRMRLEAQGYAVEEASDGFAAIERAQQLRPDLILLDIMMPKLDGIETVRQLKQDPELRLIPVILVTAKADTKDVVEGLDAGGDDYLTKPFDHAALVARVRSMLRQKALHDMVQDQAREIARWNTELESRVAAQIAEIERMSRLRRFLPPAVAELVTASGEDLLQSHRREVTVVFCDLRGFTSFAETSEPEEVLGVLGEYHACLGALIQKHEGTLERFLGDGLLVVFNDPLPCPDHPGRAVKMALEMRDAMTALSEDWRRNGHQLGFGVGIAQGYATLGPIGYEGRTDYAAIGSVPNMASRLCDKANAGQVLVSKRVYSSVEGRVEAREIGDLNLKGFHHPVLTFDVGCWL